MVKRNKSRIFACELPSRLLAVCAVAVVLAGCYGASEYAGLVSGETSEATEDSIAESEQFLSLIHI